MHDERRELTAGDCSHFLPFRFGSPLRNSNSVRRDKRLRKLVMSNDESEFVKNTLRICQEIQNRFYSERIKLGDVDPKEPWWLSKVSQIAINADRILSDIPGAAEWTNDFKNPSSRSQ